MNHVWPDLQRHAHIGGTGCGGEACGVREQRLGRSHLDQRRRQALQVSVERGDLRVLPVRPGWKISIGQFAEVALVDDRI